MVFQSCPVCRTRVQGFYPLPAHYVEQAKKHGFPHGLDEAETMNHHRYACPSCHATDRDRLYAAFFGRVFNSLNEARPYAFLDIAPSASLSRWIKSHPHVFYRSCDMYMAGVDDRADVQQLPYADDSFDFILCSHVLEHVPDDVKAASELRRVLKPDGIAVIMVPIITTITDTYENPEIVTPEQRWRHFGQDDHVRLYSRSGFLRTLEGAAFHTQVLPVLELMTPERCDTHGISQRSVLYFSAKRAKSNSVMPDAA